jgi:lipoprotein-anchoring transpeptidase ErfK/SrfK
MRVLLANLVLALATPAWAASDAFSMQVMLDRAGFSPGAIDGRAGRNTIQALAAYERERGSDAAAADDALTPYAITAADVAGPWAPEIPADLVAQSSLPALAYRSPLEALAERFHTTEATLQRLNPGAAFVAGEEVTVPNVEPFIAPTANDVPYSARPDVVVTVSKSQSSLAVHDGDGRMVFYAPVTTGSEHDPLPLGEWKIEGIQFNPEFHYDPQLFWDAGASHSKAVIAAGPNNPVGVVWIDLSKPHYGLHGTPEPRAIGRTESHGCVRLTNWDAVRVARLVKPGTRVIFTDE